MYKLTLCILFSVKKELEIDNIVSKYFHLRYTYNEICKILEKELRLKLSLSSLKRIIKRNNLRRKSIIESPVEQITAAIVEEINDGGFNLGYRFMWQRLRDKYRLSVKQSTVLEILRVLDPEGVEARSRYRLKRRRYRMAGPNYLWHCDGYDKLKKFGFAIHGCVDGYSRKVLWLHVATSNNKPEIVAYYYLKCVRELGFLPTMIRSDRGSDNTIIDQLQIALRFHHEDSCAGVDSFLKGKSTSNERIEKFWNHLRNHSMDFFISLFKTMQDQNILDISNVLHIEVLCYCFGDLIAYH